MKLFLASANAEELAAQAAVTPAPEVVEQVVEEAVEADPTWFQKAFGDFAEISWITWLAVGAFLLLFVILMVIAKRGKKWSAHMLAMGALTIAMSFLLSYIKLWDMPMGGSVTLCSMLPVMLFAYAYGLPHGLLVGLGYGMLQLLQTQPAVADLAATILDYPIAFALLALAALGRKLPKKIGLYAGVVIGGLGRFLASYLSGVIFYGIYAPYNPLLYSFVYNISYLGLEIVLCLVLVSIPNVHNAIKTIYKVK